MSRLADVFARYRETGECALISFITAGDPEPGVTVDMMHALVNSGVDVLELGIPFSDPMADGPVIQQASERALAHDVSLTDVMHMVREFREKDAVTPVVLMGYLNPIEVMGAQEFAASASESGVDGVITVDLPPDSSEALIPALQQHGVDPVFLLAPTTTEARVRQIAAVASGFLYYVSLKGVTGASSLDVAAVEARLNDVRTMTDLPLGVGFGISDAESAAGVAGVADAVVVGSAIVRRMGELASDRDAMFREVREFVSGLKQAMTQAGGG